MTTVSPQAHLWLIVPATCQIKGQLVTDEETRFVFGDPGRDGHTIEFEREALARFCVLADELLAATTPKEI